MVGINSYFAGVDHHTPPNFVVKNSENKCLLRLNSNYTIGVDSNNPPNFVIENAEGKKVLKLSSSFFMGQSENNPSNFVIEKEGVELLNLGPNFFIGEDGDTPPNFVVKNAEGKSIFKLNSAGTDASAEKVFFEAHLSKNMRILENKKNTFIPDTIVENIGSHFNKETGEFKAPSTGLYHFDTCITTNTRELNNGEFLYNFKLLYHLNIADRVYTSITNPNEYGMHAPPFQFSFCISKTSHMLAEQVAHVALELLYAQGAAKREMFAIGSSESIRSSFSGYQVT